MTIPRTILCKLGNRGQGVLTSLFRSSKPDCYLIRTNANLRCMCTTASKSVTANETQKNDAEESNLKNKFKHLMRKVPQTVVVVTTAEYDILHDKWHKRGMTCTSFTSVSFTPPIISFCIKNPSQMHEILLRTQHFAVHVLGKNQLKYGMSFAEHKDGEECPFQKIPHDQNEEGIPLIHGSSALMQCKAHSVNMVGDHHVWYGRVIDAEINEEPVDPLLYFVRSFRSVGDEIFIQAFEDATLPFEDWTHKAHLRMAWTYITEHGKDGATPHIKEGIKRFNEQNKDKVKFGYHETITMYYISMVADAVAKSRQDFDFEEFMQDKAYLLDKNVISQYYTRERLYSDEARHRFVTPDLKPLPS